MGLFDIEILAEFELCVENSKFVWSGVRLCSLKVFDLPLIFWQSITIELPLISLDKYFSNNFELNYDIVFRRIVANGCNDVYYCKLSIQLRRQIMSFSFLIIDNVFQIELRICIFHSVQILIVGCSIHFEFIIDASSMMWDVILKFHSIQILFIVYSIYFNYCVDASSV